jgi:ABC-type lipoprotein export system ATPase subunit
VNTTTQLSARNIYRSFKIGNRKVEVLRGINLDINQGELVFLCGASGAGKTTLLYTLAGLERPEAGEVMFENHKFYSNGATQDAKIRNRRMGFVFQGYFLLPELTALENTLLPTLIRHGPDPAIATGYLERVGLADRMHHLPNELSGGEQQRVAIARALVNDPAIVFADEPTGNLDTANGEAIMELLAELVREQRKTLVVVTHDERLAVRGDRLIHIRDGLFVN